MKKILSALVIVAALALFAFYAVVYSPWFPAQVLKYWLNGQNNMTLEDFGFEGRSTSLRLISFNNLFCKIKQDNAIIDFRAERLGFSAAKNFFSGDKKFYVILKNGQISRDGLNIRALNLTLQIDAKAHPRELSGYWTASSLSWEKYLAAEVGSRISGSLPTIHLKELEASGYGGKINGDILLRFRGVVAYNVNLQFKNIQIAQLQEINQAIFSQVDGILDSHISFKGTSRGLRDYASSFHLHEGGKINPRIVNLFTQYLPDMPQKAAIDELIKSGANLPVKLLNIQVEHTGREKEVVKIDLESDVVNIQDIITDGRFFINRGDFLAVGENTPNGKPGNFKRLVVKHL